MPEPSAAIALACAAGQAELHHLSVAGEVTTQSFLRPRSSGSRFTTAPVGTRGPPSGCGRRTSEVVRELSFIASPSKLDMAPPGRAACAEPRRATLCAGAAEDDPAPRLLSGCMPGWSWRSRRDRSRGVIDRHLTRRQTRTRTHARRVRRCSNTWATTTTTTGLQEGKWATSP